MLSTMSLALAFLSGMLAGIVVITIICSLCYWKEVVKGKYDDE